MSDDFSGVKPPMRRISGVDPQVLKRAALARQHVLQAVEEVMARIPNAARLYYTGSSTRRYCRASTTKGPGEPLVFRDLAEREIRRLMQERDALKADNRLLHSGQLDLVNRIADLEGDVARDAARYRYLRNLPIEQTGMPGQPCIAMPNGMQSGYYLTEETADHAVDTSMAAKNLGDG